MTVARATVFYCTLCERRKESAAMIRVMTQQHRRKLAQQRRQSNNIADEAITHKPIQYDKLMTMAMNINKYQL